MSEKLVNSLTLSQEIKLCYWSQKIRTLDDILSFLLEK